MSAAIGSLIIYQATHTPIWLAISELTAFINLFNLIPVWQLDGSRGFHALSHAERGLAVVAVGIALWATGVGVLWFVAAIGLYRAVSGESGPGHYPTLATYFLLVFALSWLARSVG